MKVCDRGGKWERCEDGVVKWSGRHSALHHQKVNGVYGSRTSAAVPGRGCVVTQKPEKHKRES